MKLIHSLARYGHHDKSCELHGEPIMPGDERCSCGLSEAADKPDALIEQALEALEWSLEVANLYFDEHNQDPYRNGHYCQLVDFISTIKQYTR